MLEKSVDSAWSTAGMLAVFFITAPETMAITTPPMHCIFAQYIGAIF
jgi:hypothetical protein